MADVWRLQHCLVDNPVVVAVNEIGRANSGGRLVHV